MALADYAKKKWFSFDGSQYPAARGYLLFAAVKANYHDFCHVVLPPDFDFTAFAFSFDGSTEIAPIGYAVRPDRAAVYVIPVNDLSQVTGVWVYAEGPSNSNLQDLSSFDPQLCLFFNKFDEEWEFVAGGDSYSLTDYDWFWHYHYSRNYWGREWRHSSKSYVVAEDNRISLSFLGRYTGNCGDSLIEVRHLDNSFVCRVGMVGTHNVTSYWYMNNALFIADYDGSQCYTDSGHVIRQRPTRRCGVGEVVSVTGVFSESEATAYYNGEVVATATPPAAGYCQLVAGTEVRYHLNLEWVIYLDMFALRYGDYEPNGFHLCLLDGCERQIALTSDDSQLDFLLQGQHDFSFYYKELAGYVTEGGAPQRNPLTVLRCDVNGVSSVVYRTFPTPSGYWKAALSPVSVRELSVEADDKRYVVFCVDPDCIYNAKIYSCLTPVVVQYDVGSKVFMPKPAQVSQRAFLFDWMDN